MIWLYVASAVFGGSFAIPMVLGGMDFDADVEFDGDFDADMDVAGDVGGDLVAHGPDMGVSFFDGVGDLVSAMLSFRSLVFATLFFGVAGMVLTATGSAELFTLVAAAALGIFAATVNGSAMRFLMGSQSSSHITTSDMHGSLAQVVLPVGDDRKGRIRAEIAGQTEYFTALPMRSGGDEFVTGQEVVIVEVDNGTARIASIAARELGG